MLQIPDVYVAVGYFKGLDAYLWWAFTALCVVACIIFLLRMKKAETPSQKNLYLGYGLFSLSYGITRFFFILGILFPDQYEFFTGLGYIPSIAGGLAIIFVAELYLITKTKKIISIFLLIALVISILGVAGVYSREVYYSLVVVIALVAVLFILIIYIMLIRVSTGGIRKKTIGAFIGILLLSVAAVLDSQVGVTLLAGNILIPPIMIIIGLVFFVVFQRAT